MVCVGWAFVLIQMYKYKVVLIFNLNIRNLIERLHIRDISGKDLDELLYWNIQRLSDTNKLNNPCE